MEMVERRGRRKTQTNLSSFMTPYEKTKLYRMRHPERIKAHRLIFGAVRNGQLIRKPCRVCKAEKVEAHHTDYSKPFRVVWLCKKHHIQADKRLSKKSFPQVALTPIVDSI